MVPSTVPSKRLAFVVQMYIVVHLLHSFILCNEHRFDEELCSNIFWCMSYLQPRQKNIKKQNHYEVLIWIDTIWDLFYLYSRSLSCKCRDFPKKFFINSAYWLFNSISVFSEIISTISWFFSYTAGTVSNITVATSTEQKRNNISTNLNLSNILVWNMSLSW